MNVWDELGKAYPNKLVLALLAAYSEIEINYSLGKWKASELDSGHFVEASRRILEHVLFGSHTPINKSLPGFSDSVIKKYEQASGDESYRMLIPRALKSIYNIRNKRGVGHLSDISPNEMDATYILNTSKWVLAEFLRLSSGQDPKVTQDAIAGIVEKKIGLIWKHEDITRILNEKISTRNQVLIILFDATEVNIETAQNITEYKNTTNFKKILKRLHSERFIEFDGARCRITPKGITEAEKIINKAGY